MVNLSTTCRNSSPRIRPLKAPKALSIRAGLNDSQARTYWNLTNHAGEQFSKRCQKRRHCLREVFYFFLFLILQPKVYLQCQKTAALTVILLCWIWWRFSHKNHTKSEKFTLCRVWVLSRLELWNFLLLFRKKFVKTREKMDQNERHLTVCSVHCWYPTVYLFTSGVYPSSILFRYLWLDRLASFLMGDAHALTPTPTRTHTHTPMKFILRWRIDLKNFGPFMTLELLTSAKKSLNATLAQRWKQKSFIGIAQDISTRFRKNSNLEKSRKIIIFFLVI